MQLLAGVCQLSLGFVDATDEAVRCGAVRSLGRSGIRRRGARLIVVVHCSDGDVMVSVRLPVGTLFGAE